MSASAAFACHPDFDGYARVFEGDWSDNGLDKLRNLYLKWLAPWETYRQEIEEVIDLGERVLVLARDFACRREGTHEVENKTAVVFTALLGNRHLPRGPHHPRALRDHEQALKAAGLEE